MKTAEQWVLDHDRVPLTPENLTNLVRSVQADAVRWAWHHSDYKRVIQEKMLELEAGTSVQPPPGAPAGPAWTKAPPECEGWYWFYELGEPHMVRVRGFRSGFIVLMHEGPCNVKDMIAFWLGPIPKPSNPSLIGNCFFAAPTVFMTAFHFRRRNRGRPKPVTKQPVPDGRGVSC